MKKIFLFVCCLSSASCFGPRSPGSNSDLLFTDYVTTTPEPVETLDPGAKPVYEVAVEDQRGVKVVTVRFRGKLPPPEVVDKIFRDEFEKVVKKHPEMDALGYACSENNICLSGNQYSGDLAYEAAQMKIISADEANGITASEQDNDSYYVLTQEMSPPNLSTPIKPMLFLWLVFPKPPRQKEAYEGIIAEIVKVRDRSLDVMVYVKVGDRNKKTSWYEIKGDDGRTISANYIPPPLDTIYTKGDIILKQF